MKRLLTYLSAIIIMMMVPIGMQAVNDIYLIGSTLNNAKWDAKGSYKFTYDGGTNQATITLPASTLSGGTNNNTVYLALWVDQGGTSGYSLRPNSTTVLAIGSGSLQLKSDNNTNGKSLQLNSVSNSSDKEYVITLSNCVFASNGYDMSSCDVSVVENTIQTGGGGGTTTDAAYYLVGNFFNTDNETNINYNNRYFKFNKQSDGSYMVEIPATVTANMQILSVDGSTTAVYGPGSRYGIHAANGSAAGWPATDGSVSDRLTKSTTLALNNNYWKLTTRNNNTSAGDDDGLYEVSFTLNSSGVPSDWTIKHVSTKRVVYFLSTAPGAVATPLYDKRNDVKAAYTNATKGYLHFDASNQYWVLSNIVYKDIIDNTGSYYCGTNLGAHKNNRSRDILPTTNKLVYKGNGNRVFATDKYGNEVSPNEQAIAANYLKNNQNATYEVQYNPSNGDGDLAKSENHWGMRGQIQFLGGTSADDNIKSVSMVGPAIPGTTSGTTWNWASTAGDMTWDVTENCYKLTLTTTAPAGEHFRFVANHAQAKNFYETNTTARIPYDGTATSGTSAATEEDPNDVAYTTSGTTSYTESSYDILFNRPAGEWTVRFYLTYDKEQNKSFYYTITGTENTNPDATLKPGTDGGNYDFDNYETGTAKTLTVTLSNATKYAYAIGANSNVTLDESSTKTDDTFTLTYDGTNVTDGFGNVVTGKTVYIKIQGQDDSNKGTTHTYQYTFNVPSSTFYFTPKGGLFINSAKITVEGGKEPFTYTVKDASGNVRSTGKFVLDGNADDDNYRISTPGYLTVTDANGNTATSNELFDFTYSTSENYKNYNNNATGSKIIQTGGGQGALNVFINKNDDLETLWLYAYNKTLDTELKAKTGWKQDEVDKQVRLTDAFPGNDLTKAPTITIDGIKYVHFTIPVDNLRKDKDDKVAIIVSQGNTQAENWWTQTTYAGVEIARTEDPAFIYNVKNVPATKADDSWNYKGTNQLYQIAADGSRTIFFTKPDGWTEPIYCHAEDPSKPYCYFVDTDSWGSNLRIWAWDENNGNKNYTGGTWPGATMTQVGDNGASGDSKRYVYRWEYSSNVEGKPNKVKFSNNGGNEKGNFNFYNGAIYNTSGLVKYNEKPTSDKMALKEGNIYTFSVPVGSTKLYFYDANGNKTSVVTYSSDARNHYTWDGSTLNSTSASYAVDTKEYNDFLNTPPTTTVVTQKYPNGEDYWRAAPGDLSIKLDPTWGGKTLEDEATTHDWAGNMPKKINTTQMPLTQTIQGLNAGKTYTVQAIVRGLGQEGKTVTLTLEGATTVSKTLNLRNGSGNSENSADLSRQGSEITRTGRVEYIEPSNLTGMNKYDGADAGGWAKVEATVNASQAGWLTIKLESNGEWFDLSQVTLLEDANTDHGFRTTASTSATDTDLANVDFRDRSWKKNNAYSFFDRGKNRNAVIFANDRTVIAMNPDHLADVEQNEALKAVDRRHPFNVVGSDENDTKVGTAKALYLTDMGYGGNTTDYPGDADDPVDYDQTGNITGYSRSGYTFMPKFALKAQDVIFDRQLGGESYKKQTTILLPFEITVTELKKYYGNDVKVWKYNGYNLAKKTILFTEVKETETTEANVPYILTEANGKLDSRKLSSGDKSVKEVAVIQNAEQHTATSDGGFTGSYKYQDIPRTATINGTKLTHFAFNPTTGKFQVIHKNGAAMKPFRAYFSVPVVIEENNNAPAFTVIFDDTTTGISESVQVNVEPTNVYTLGGILVARNGDLSRLPKGVYIVNGKKVIK